MYYQYLQFITWTIDKDYRLGLNILWEINIGLTTKQGLFQSTSLQKYEK